MTDRELFEIDRHDDDLLIPVGNETVAARRYEPVDVDERLPVVLMCVPYRKDDWVTFGGHEPSLEYFARHGYEVVIADLVGTGGSTGTMPQPFHTPDEAPQLEAIIEWIADREWNTGRIGMYGHSWGGQVQFRAASRNPKGLEALIPVMPAMDPYFDGFYRGGVRKAHVCTFPTFFQTLMALPPSRRDDQGRWRDVWKEHLDGLRDTEPFMFQMLDHPTKDEYWLDKDVPAADVDLPIFVVAGYQDYHPQSNIQAFLDATGEKRLLLGPWSHHTLYSGDDHPVDFRRQAVEWFDYFLKDEDNGALDHPPVEFLTERHRTSGEGTWRETDRWPDAFTGTDVDDPFRFALSPEGVVPVDDFVDGTVRRDYEFDHSVGMESVDDVPGVDRLVDTNGDDARSLSFESAPFDRALELTGTGVARVHLEPATPDPILAVRLMDVNASGGSTLISYGYVDPTHVESESHTGRYPHLLVSDDPVALTPGERYEIPVPLKPKSYLLEPGHSLRVAISAASFPNTFPTTHGSFTVLSTPDRPSTITLPGTERPDGATFEDSVDMNPPDQRVPTSSAYVEPATGDEANSWQVSRNYTNGKAAFQARSMCNTTHLPHGPELSTERQLDVSVTTDEPETAIVKTTFEATLDFGFETVRAETTGRMGQEMAQIETRAWVDENLVFHRAWNR